MERFIGFYASKPFWAGEKVNVDDIENIKCHFTESMSHEVFVYDTEEYILKICKDGMFLFQIKEIAKQLNEEMKSDTSPDTEHTIKQWSTYLDHLNCIYLLFESSVLKKLKLAYFEISEISNKDAFGVRFENSKFSGCSISELSFAYKFQMGRFLSDYRGDISLTLALKSDPRILPRIEIPKIVFDTLHSDFSIIYKNHKNVKMLSEITKSLGEYKIVNYSTALILSWFVIESYLFAYWNKLLDSKNITHDDGSKRISSERREYLLGRDYPLSVISNMLELFDQTSFETFRKIDKVRKIRNKIVHPDNDESSCGHEICQTAFDIIKEFVRHETGVDLKFNLSYSIRSL